MNVSRISAAIAVSFLLQLVPLRAADSIPPTVVSVTPAPGGTIGNLAQVTVVFSEPVVDVEAWNLQINGADAATVSAGGFTNFTFSFTQPPPGMVSVHWDATQTITDQAGNPFSPDSPWQYTLLDSTGPTVLLTTPVAGATVGNLTQVAVTFSEPVLGVDASDL